MTTYGVIGVGSIAAAIVTGLCRGLGDPPEIVLSPGNAGRAAGLAEAFPSARVADDNQQAVDERRVIICLRPVHAAGVLSQLTFRADQAVVSAVAGLRVAELAELRQPPQMSHG